MGKAYLNENLVYICTYLLHLCAITCLHDSEVEQSKVRKKIITNTRTTELIGVYDADATIIGEISYWIGARLGIRHCSLWAFTFASVSIEGQPIEILPSGTTPDASTIIKLGAPVANESR